jgi:hypothetical protein
MRVMRRPSGGRVVEARWSDPVRGFESDHRGLASATVVDAPPLPHGAEIGPGESWLVIDVVAMTSTVLVDAGISDPQRC